MSGDHLRPPGPQRPTNSPPGGTSSRFSTIPGRAPRRVRRHRLVPTALTQLLRRLRSRSDPRSTRQEAPLLCQDGRLQGHSAGRKPDAPHRGRGRPPTAPEARSTVVRQEGHGPVRRNHAREGQARAGQAGGTARWWTPARRCIRSRSASRSSPSSEGTCGSIPAWGRAWWKP